MSVSRRHRGWEEFQSMNGLEFLPWSAQTCPVGMTGDALVRLFSADLPESIALHKNCPVHPATLYLLELKNLLLQGLSMKWDVRIPLYLFMYGVSTNSK